MRSGFARSLCLGLILATPALIELASPGGPGGLVRVLAVDAVLLAGLSFALRQRACLRLERQRMRRPARISVGVRSARGLRPAAANAPSSRPLAAV